MTPLNFVKDAPTTIPISPGDQERIQNSPTGSQDVDLQRIAPKREERLFLVLSIFIGVLSGLLVVSFRVAIEWVQTILLGSAPHAHEPRLIIVPACAGLFVAALVRWVFPGARGSGVNQTKAALYIYNGFISFKTVIGKFITSAIAIGSGHSLGPEDPSLQIGAGVASIVARKLRLSRQSLRLFAPIGAAAGLAAAFNAPISAILFVIEEVIGYWSAAVLGSVVLAAIASVSVARIFWGSAPMFRIPTVTLRDPRELTAYAALGVIGGLSAFVFAKALSTLRPRLRAMSPNAQLFQPAIAGLLVGCIGYFGFPQVMGPGYEVMDQALHGQFTWQVLAALVAFKMIATTLSFSSGTPGGMFAPALFIGTMLGAAVGTVEHMLLPHASGAVGSYALVGMGVFFAAFLRAPLTSVFMVLETSGNYSIILPVILANTIAYLIARSLQPTAIFELFTHQDGLDLPSMEEQREEVGLHLEDALTPLRVPLLRSTESLTAAVNQLSLNPEERAMVVQMQDGSCYVLQAFELAMLVQITPESTTLQKALPAERTPLLFPDLPLDSALRHLSRWPLLPISNRASKGTLEGMVTLEDVLARYQRG
ncbi:chloride channel protein [Acidipila sp. EB88]|uniref:chloride channel protein n=1 Tax=Acidipila sp. EB88 TaxID=2305226 RepID=UPI000F5EC35E|nr:chloride channel protein [Acidipila sp. EB88]RRA49012.1 chloride channel protein [Acidipila sp. EB88]